MISRRQFLGSLAVSAAVAMLPQVGAAQNAADRKPNIVIIFTDDQGYQDLGCYGSPLIKTPRIDQMAREGTRFTSFYVASPVCTPSRAGLLTGCYPARIGLAYGVLFPNAAIGLNPGEVTIASMLKAQGYATACIGKWHLGDAPEFLPTRHGFDSYFGIPYSNDMRIKRGEAVGPPLMRDDQIVEHPADQATLTERYTNEAVKFITANRDKPFFLYLPHTMPHCPLHVSERFAGKSQRGLYGDVIETIDWSTGRILDTIKSLGLDEHTLVIYTSDNGPWLVKKENGGSALPLRDGKSTVYEGGMREPCIMRWPGRIPAGRVCDEMVLTLDLLPTIAGLTGASVPGGRVIDGRDAWPVIRGDAGAATPHEAFFYHATKGALAAVRSGKWKLHLKDPAELYDLDRDISESTNLAEQHPDVVDRLKRLAAAHGDDLAKNSRPVGQSSHVPAENGPGRNDPANPKKP